MFSSPILKTCVVAACLSLFSSAIHADVFSQGQPTDEEQYFLELVNRARSNPAGEAAMLGIGLNQGLPPGTISPAAKQPLAFHPSLLNSARSHSQYLLNTNNFTHTGAGGTSPSQRMTAAGYPSNSWTAENLGWTWLPGGTDPTALMHRIHRGLFESSGHRISVLNGIYSEVGIAPRLGTFRSGGSNYHGAMMVVQNFGLSVQNPGSMVTGVVYYDLNGNGAYDIGEGVGGVAVTAPGVDYTTQTSVSGGYALPVGAGVHTLSLQMTEAGEIERTVSVLNENVKLDLRLAYQAPVLGGSNSAAVGQVTSFPYSYVAGATSYLVKMSETSRYIPPDGAEAGLLHMRRGTTKNPVQRKVKKSGRNAYQFTHPKPTSQYLYVNRNLVPTGAASMYFYSRLGIASKSQVAKVEVSMDGGRSWAPAWAKRGRGAKKADKKFRNQGVYLGHYAGREIQVRLAYEWRRGKYYRQTRKGFGWYVDDIRFNGMSELVATRHIEVPSDKDFEIIFPRSADYSFSMAPRLPGRVLPFGPQKTVFAR